jgi:hypothetical protein
MSKLQPEVLGLANEAYETARERGSELSLSDADIAQGLVLAACAAARRAGAFVPELLPDAIAHLDRLEHDTEPGASIRPSSLPPAP